MGISSKLKSIFARQIIPKATYLDILNTPVETDKYAVLTGWYYSPRLGQPRGSTPISTMRKFAQTPQVRMCTKTIIDEITGIKWDIVPKNRYKDNYDEAKLQEIRDFFNNPNRNGESFEDILKMLLKDILEIDAGVIVKTFTKNSYGTKKKFSYTYKTEKGETAYGTYFAKALTKNATLKEIYVRDGGSFLIAPNAYGILPEDTPAYYQYSFIHPNAEPLPFYKREIVYFKMNPRSNSPYGWSPIQSLFMILESLNNAIRYNKKYFENSAIPDGVLSLINANKESFNRFMHKWKKEIKGKPHKLVIFNEDMKFTPFAFKNKDMEWLEGQKFYQRLVWAMYGVTADELGFTETSNRSVGQTQSKVFIRRAIKPYLQILERKFTNEVIGEFYDGKEPEVMLKFHFIDENEERMKREEEWNDVRYNIRSINEIRLDRGLEPVEWGDGKPTSSPSVYFQQQEKSLKKKTIKKEIKKDDKPENNDPNKKEYAGYEDFLNNYWDEIKQETIKAFEKEIPILKENKANINKSLSGFIRRISKIFSPVILYDLVTKYLNKEYNIGIKDVEDELNIDIGVHESERQKIEQYAKQQVDGYILPDGKKWGGIKGVNDDIKLKVGEAINKGILSGKSVQEISEDIQSVFDTTKNHAMMIARTESIRIRNEAHNIAYLKSGLKGRKKWSAHIDAHTSKECRELDGQIVPLDGVFKLEDGRQFVHPPAHINCRSRIIFVPD